MTDILEQSSAWLEAQRHLHRTREVIYRRGAQSVTLQATIGRTTFERSDEYGAVVETQVRDYLIRAQDLVWAGQLAVPEHGDRIEETDADGNTLVYEVLPLAGEPPWRYSDPYRQTLRIHTKQVAVSD